MGKLGNALAELTKQTHGRQLERTLRETAIAAAQLLHAETMLKQKVDAVALAERMQTFSQARQAAEAALPALRELLPPDDRRAVVVLMAAMITKQS